MNPLCFNRGRAAGLDFFPWKLNSDDAEAPSEYVTYCRGWLDPRLGTRRAP